MNNYLKILQLEKQILEQSGNLHWAKWIEKDIQEWKANQSTKHHLEAFGGMGSINDITIGENNKKGSWQENLFHLLKSMSWTFAKKNKIEFPKVNVQEFEGMICRKCEYSEISEYSFSAILAKRNLPNLIFKLLPSENFEVLLRPEEITKDTTIENESEKLKIALSNSFIIEKPFYTVYPKCPKCDSKNSCVYRWELLDNGCEFIIKRSSNNLKLEKDILEKKTKSWINKILGKR
jgi:predicted nucleic-acid-binding Zn-ribbon protein